MVKVEFDPAKLSLEKVLAVFWKAHDPTTLNRQGADVGTQYRSAIFFHNDADKAVAEKSMQAAGKSGEFRSPIVTEIPGLEHFTRPRSITKTTSIEL
ncbi:MAG: hypothetical protein CM1200mP29_12540 [Verrucomicrobiota bacterium]|nr:MAG: hypothetical protein CM1200mP29_12540 [Verrucomicrobiota bacterium]